ncbi:DUF4254 domain-containing protein [Mycobacterium sp. Lab-001]|uniref:DUF4254 domain-containing protein n=1 Tax=Mycobacterium sp. Lab-001 TaxID=3410136 RepID=UPI003D17F12D
MTERLPRAPLPRLRDSTAAELLHAARRFQEAALEWHRTAPAASDTNDRVTARALHLHALNFDLWHHEDAVRRPGVGDPEVARGKRAIDDLNARRNAAVENLDATLLERLDPVRSAPLHTETPAMIVDRLSVLTLRMVHTPDAERNGSRLAVLEQQYDDLIGGLERFLACIRDGHIGFTVYRQFKSAGQQGYCTLFEDPGER